MTATTKKGNRTITVTNHKNGLIIKGATTAEVEKLNNSYSTGLNPVKSGQDWIIPGLFGLANQIIESINQGEYKF